MSADNGIYILRTPKGDKVEFRVAHLQAIENYEYDERTNEQTKDPNVHITNARKMWKDSPIFKTERSVLLFAEHMARDYSILEYGICFINIDREF